ncbi:MULTISPECIES: autotransporter domain-containing protein [Psychrilyobacter]|nr:MULTISPECIES: autotransporter domain-containing protein [Psychrilyobacter]MCS5422363.1 autotransporter domain-containing protein [Psychrilyobacter sp. S5]NDI78048.1 autotransporter outer membrane beta-barrel domain-containing protein [Psychrilyobacter piezotolerans]
MKVEKVLKRWLKRKVKITQVLLVTFLITGSIGYSQVITGDSGQIIIKDSNTTLKVEESGKVDSREKKSTTDNLGFVGVKDVSGNGVIVRSDVEGVILENVGIENIGIIAGGLTSEVGNKPLLIQKQGNGIYDGERVSKIENSGKIAGEVSAKGSLFVDIREEDYEGVEGQIYKSGNGIYGGTVVNNTGTIEGDANSEGGKIDDPTKVIVYAGTDVVRSGNGVVGEVEKNSGVIRGNAVLKGGESILGKADIDPTGDEVYSYADVSSGYDYGPDDELEGKSGNGVYGGVKNNSGVITGDIDLQGGLATARALKYAEAGAEATATKSGNGVLGEVGENIGTIRGDAVLKGGSSIGVVDGTAEGKVGAYAYAYAVGSGNGVDGGVKNNSGTITGRVDLEGGALNGIDVGGDVGVVEKSTVVFVSADIAEARAYEVADADKSGNGVGGYVEENSGIIKGRAVLKGSSTGDGIFAEAEGKEAYVRADADAYANLSGNGVLGGVGKNSKIIKGKALLEGGRAEGDAQRQNFEEGNDVSPEIAIVEAYASAIAYESGNGVMGGVEENSGFIRGRVISQGGTAASMIEGIKNESDVNSDATADLSGNGVVGKVDTNSGIIRGRADLQGGTTRVDLTGPTGDSIVKSIAEADAYESGNGILGDAGKNRGIIEGSSRSHGGSEDGTISGNNLVSGWANLSGNGIYGAKAGENRGIIRGRVDLIEGKVNGTDAGSGSTFSGNGIAYNGEIKDFPNSGLVAGSKSAIAAVSVNNIVNNGVMAGQEIYGDGQDSMGTMDETGTTNNGVYVRLNTDGSVVNVENSSATGTIVGGREIINTGLKNSNSDSYDTFTSDISNKIINGAGVGSGVMTVDGTVKVENSMVNGYDKAVILNDGSSLTAVDTVFNGGGVGAIEDNGTPDDITDDYVRYNPIIVGSDGDNELTLAGKTILNGDIDVKGGIDNHLVIGSPVQLNGDLYGSENKDSEDRLELGDKPVAGQENEELIISGNVKDFENMEVRGEVTFTERAKIEGAEKIEISDNSTLNVRVDTEKTDGDGRVTGHALYENNLIVASEEDGAEENGTLNIVTSGVGRGVVVALSDTHNNKVTIDEDIQLKTDSIIHDAVIDGNGDIVVGVEDDLPVDGGGETYYEKLDLVYKSIISSGDTNIDALNPTVASGAADAAKELYILLNDIYAANPYGYSLYASKESMKTFSETALNKPFKADKKKWMIYGGPIYNDDKFTKKHSTSYENIESERSIFGGYGLAEYGLSDKTSAGIIVGGNNNKVDISNGSKLDGDSFYIGAYGKTEVSNFRFIAGGGYQYTDYDSRRIAANKYQDHKYEESYSNNGFDAYIGSIYSYEFGQSYFLEPKINLTYTRISQDSIDEGNEDLAIETGSKTEDYLDGEVGIDLVKEMNFYQGSAKIKGGISYIRALTVTDKSILTGNMKGGSDFDILITERDEDLMKAGISFEGEQNSGFIYDVGGGYLAGSDTDDYYVSVGIGYKF